MKIPRTGVIYKTGNATQPDTPSIIINICDNAGIWDDAFKLALSATDRTPQIEYNKWFTSRTTQSGVRFELGGVQLSRYNDIHLVANIIARDALTHTQPNPLAYETLRIWLEKLTLIAQKAKLPVVGPKFHIDIHEQHWGIIEEMIEDTLVAHDIPVTIYTQ